MLSLWHMTDQAATSDDTVTLCTQAIPWNYGMLPQTWEVHMKALFGLLVLAKSGHLVDHLSSCCILCRTLIISTTTAAASRSVLL